MNRAILVCGALLLALPIALSGHSVIFADSVANNYHQDLQDRPIELGTSGGNIFDRSSVFCCSGTLGSLVEDLAGNQYILSNNHVIARFNQGATGEPVNQPGQIDQNCAQVGVVAQLTDFVKIQTSKGRSIKYNVVDAAIASVDPGAVQADGSILDIGPVHSDTMPAFVGQAVKKSGRTTGLTHGEVVAIGVTVGVGYSKSCGGAANQTAYFENQIRIGSGSFSAGGDSGSLIVEDVASQPKALGLLFAGSSTSTLANPIGDVLNLLGVQMASGTPLPPPDTGSISGTVTQAVGGAAIDGATVSADTGQSTTTNGSGDYTLSNVPVGTRTVTASATGFVSDSTDVTVVKDSITTGADIALAVAVEPTMVQAACVTLDAKGGRNSTKDALFSVRIVDDFGNAVAGATVNISVDLDTALFGTGTGALSDSNGNVTYNAKNAPDGLYVITSVTVTASGLTYVGSAPDNSFDKGGKDSGPVSFCNTGFDSSGGAEGLTQEISRARAAKARGSQRLMGIPGVVGHGIGLSDDGHPVIEVYLANENASARAQIPNNVENFAVRVVVTGTFEAF